MRRLPPCDGRGVLDELVSPEDLEVVLQTAPLCLLGHQPREHPWLAQSRLLAHLLEHGQRLLADSHLERMGSRGRHDGILADALDALTDEVGDGSRSRGGAVIAPRAAGRVMPDIGGSTDVRPGPQPLGFGSALAWGSALAATDRVRTLDRPSDKTREATFATVGLVTLLVLDFATLLTSSRLRCDASRLPRRLDTSSRLDVRRAGRRPSPFRCLTVRMTGLTVT